MAPYSLSFSNRYTTRSSTLDTFVQLNCTHCASVRHTRLSTTLNRPSSSWRYFISASFSRKGTLGRIRAETQPKMRVSNENHSLCHIFTLSSHSIARLLPVSTRGVARQITMHSSSITPSSVWPCYIGPTWKLHHPSKLSHR